MISGRKSENFATHILKHDADLRFVEVGNQLVNKRINVLIVEDIDEFSVHSLGEIFQVANLGTVVNVSRVAIRVVVHAL